MAETFLLVIAFVYLAIASISDLKKREVANWLSFSLIIFVVAYRLFYSLIYNDIWFLIYGLFGILLFVGLAYAFYYARAFAGGDAKLLMGLGGIFAVGSNFYSHLLFLGLFILLLIFAGGFYGLVYSFFLAMKNKEKFFKEYKLQFGKRKKWLYVSLFFVLLSLGFVYFDALFIAFPFLIILSFLLYVYGKAVEESCMIIKIEARKATIGDWLYEKVKIRGKIIKPYWEGLDEKEVELLKKHKGKIKIKSGIPFVPAFLIAFLGWLWIRNMYFA